MSNLYKALLDYQASGVYPFHMPGHKRNREGFINPFSIDITEIEGFDNLHHAEGILREAQERAACLYGSEKTYFLVNGSTCGILSAVSACTKKGGRILMARNCHKAAYHGALLQELDIIYIYPQEERELGINGGINPEDVENRLKEYGDIQAVLITSPTFDGVVSDVERIAEIVHRYGIPLIVDEAHGAHFGFHPYFPESSVKLGADLVIHSLHKTLPSLTQTALLHLNGILADRECVERYLGIYQTSSPSYVFMAGMDQCIGLISEQKSEIFEQFSKELKAFYKCAQSWKHIRVAGKGQTGRSGIYDFDLSKLVLSVRGMNMDGNELSRTLREKYQLELEMAAGSYALALTSIADSRQGFARLKQALAEIDSSLSKSEEHPLCDTVTHNWTVCRICEALDSEREMVQLERAAGRISGEFVYLYPPGIPLLVPGERIEQEVINSILKYKDRGYAVQGLTDYKAFRIQVLVDRV